MRQYLTIHIGNDSNWLDKLHAEALMHSHSMVLTTSPDVLSVSVGGLHGRYDFLGAFGAVDIFQDRFDLLQSKLKGLADWCFGFLSYDLKNQFEHLHSDHFDGVGLPDLLFFRPRYVVVNDEQGWRVGYLSDIDSEGSVNEWMRRVANSRLIDPEAHAAVEIQPRVPVRDYLDTVDRIKQRILRGDIYEMNYCMEFFNPHADIDPLAINRRLQQLSPVPFGAFAKVGGTYLISASPERYLCKRGNRLVSQPIKGTAPRSDHRKQDEVNLLTLRDSEKERAENVMIADLVRNDLSRVAERGSVTVDELCGVYGFKQVYQMVSTVSATLRSELDWMDAIKATFPMGSMTGAPKVSAMELIETVEKTKRGLYSGAVGYVDPCGDFDFNVVIRSMLYNSATKYLSYMVGSAITHLSDPEAEYNECMLKASAINQVLGGN